MDTDRKLHNLKEYIDNVGHTDAMDFFEESAPKPCSWEEINTLKFPENPWLVKNLFPKEGISIFASISGEGKSLLVMHLAKCITEGTPWFGNPEFKTEKAKVLYINLEMSLSEIQRRGRKVGFDVENKNLIILNEDSFNLNEPLGKDDLRYKWLLSFIYEQEIKVVIIDTFRAASGGLKEEKAEEVRAFFQKFLILKNSGVSLIFLEHVRKPTQQEGKVPKKEQLLGSQDKTANAEVLLMIRRDEVARNINIYQRKNRLGNEVHPFAVKMIDSIGPNGEDLLDFSYVGEIDDDLSAKEEAKEFVLNVLSSGEGKNVKELSALVKVGSKNLRVALKELEGSGMIDHYKEGKRHVYFLPKEKEEMTLETVDEHKKLDSF